MNIQQYISLYKDGTVQITKDISYNLTDVIEDNYLAINAKFKDPLFSDGVEKEYFDPERVMSTRLKASTDIDTKDAQIHAENELTIKLSPLLRGLFRYRLKTEDYGTLFNDVRDELIDQGHVIIKKVENKTEIVDLRNVIRPPHILDIQKGGVVERTYLTWDEVLANKKDWKENWADIEALKEKMKQEHKHLFTVYEHWTMDDFKVEKKDKFTKGCIKYLDRSLMSPEQDNDWNPYLELDRFASPFKEKVRSKSRLKKLREQGYIGKNEEEEPIYPYEEARFITLRGRWLGAGVYEILRPIGKAYRRNMNNKIRFDEINHKGISVHTRGDVKGKGLTQEALQALQYGGVVGIKAGERLERLNFGSLIGEFLASADKFMELARMELGITVTATGEEVPANMPATTSAINQNIAKTTYDVIIEAQSLLWKRYFSKFELASMLEDITLEDWSKIEGDQIELEELEEPFIENLINESIPKAVEAGTFVPQSSALPPEEMGRVKEAVKIKRREMQGVRFAQVKNDIIKDADFFIEFYVNNESFDRINKIRELQILKQEAIANPTSSLSAERLEEEILDLMNLSSKRFKKTEQEKQAQALALQQMQQMQPQPVNQPNTTMV